MTVRPRIAPDWLGDPGLGAVFAALGGEALLVGGCVRNALMDRPASDIDLATPLLPETVISRLHAAGLRAVPTGIEHGTVTAVAGGRGFEVTTFRADIETDGRHAVVRFTRDVAEDARRRDFTMNALYARADGTVIDPLGGLADLVARRVRFVGRAEDRIREDYLRILRFFRFTAWYAPGPPDPVGLAACAAGLAGLAGLARERVGAEMRKLLSAADPVAAVAAMEDTGVLTCVLPGAGAGALAGLLAAERAIGAEPDWLCRLAALGNPAEPLEALRLSRAEARRLVEIAAVAEAAEPPALAAEAAGPAVARSGLLVAHARRGTLPSPGFEAELARGASAVFPLRADDLMRAGWCPGRALGAALAEARARWRAADFSLDKAALIGLLDNMGQKS